MILLGKTSVGTSTGGELVWTAVEAGCLSAIFCFSQLAWLRCGPDAGLPYSLAYSALSATTAGESVAEGGIALLVWLVLLLLVLLLLVVVLLLVVLLVLLLVLVCCWCC